MDLLALTFLALQPFIAAGQEYVVSDRTAFLRNTSEHIWNSSANAASLSLDPLEDYSVLSMDYTYKTGEYRRRQSGKNIGELDFSTEGATAVGKVRLWGDFSYSNISDKGSKYNTLLYDPFDENFMYTAADSTASDWKRQSYDMRMKAGLPVVEDRLYAGIFIHYNDRIAAKQQDPRSESYGRCIDVSPALILKTGTGAFGVNFLYSDSFTRATPTISNSQLIQRVFLLRGLGNYVEDYVGGNSLQTMYFRRSTLGAGLQYEKSAGQTRLLADLLWNRSHSTVKESPTYPKEHGRTSVDDFGAYVTALREGSLIHLAKISFNGRLATGTEVTSVWNKESGLWDVRSQVEQVSLSSMSATVSYDLRKVQGKGWNWNARAEAGWNWEYDKYKLPESTFSYDNVFAGAGFSKNFIFADSSFLLEATMRYSMNLDGSYVYSGSRKESPIVKDLFGHDIEILCSDYLLAGIRAGWSIPVGESILAEIDINPVLIYAGSRKRLSTLGGVSLYF